MNYHDKDRAPEILELAPNERPKDWSSLSTRFNSFEECRNSLHPEACKSCGHLFTTNYIPEVKKRLEASGICHNCDFWTAYLNDKRGLRIKGVHYVACSGGGGQYSGFGGDRFFIKKHDGELIETRNLWCQGDIPTLFKDRLPDNAEFIKNPQPEEETK